MTVETAVNQMKEAVGRFKVTISCFSEEDAAFAPGDGMYSVAFTVAHVGATIPWMTEGAFGAGFDMDFEAHNELVRSKSKTLASAIAYLDGELDKAVRLLATKTDDDLLAPLPEGQVMSGQPVFTVFKELTDHTAHHRGALAVYARLLGKRPRQPYLK